MSAGAQVRHRAAVRPHTPLTELRTNLANSAHALGRTGIVVAMSSGLIGTITLPAGATGQAVPTAPGSSTDTEQLVLDGGRTALPSTAGHLPPLTASADARVTFDETTRTSRLTAQRELPVSRGGQVRTASSTVRGSSVLAIAARYVGTPYLYGGTTPDGFDCSGYVRYVFAQLGHALPRTATQQLNATVRISRSQARPGDLVFFVSGGRAYHNGIYAGNGMMYDSPSSGKTVQKRAIWSSTVVFGRVTG